MSFAWGWGPQGHMVVAQIAENNLTPTAKRNVQKLLKGPTLAEVSNWADFIKGDPQWAHTKPWHFVDIPDGEDYSTIEHSHDGDIVAAITEMVKVIKSRSAKPMEKENALKFIVHFVGDIHQPLHVGRPEDRGGNDVQIVFEGRKSNLHALWDSLMIMKNPMNHVQYAAYLENQTLLPAPYDIPEMAFSQIIHECMSAREDIYNFSPGTGTIEVRDVYYKRNLERMNSQILKGGKRLAVLLNSLFK